MPKTRTTSSKLARATVESRSGTTTLRLYTPPVPASRPRISKWGTYYGKTYKAYMQAADAAIPACPPKQKLTGLVRTDVEFVCAKPKSTVRACPLGDIDNHLKSILDAVTKKGYWNDDDQIVQCKASKRWVTRGEEPHTTIKIIPL